MVTLAVWIFIAASLIGVFDIIYFHLLKYRLYAHEDSRVEHWAHTVRMFWQVPLVYLVFARNVGGELLWLAVAVVAIDIAIEAWDLVVEHGSRESLGGLGRAEYLIHMYSTMGRAASFALIFGAKPLGGWTSIAPHTLPTDYPVIASVAAGLFIPSAFAIALIHVWLLQPRYREVTS